MKLISLALHQFKGIESFSLKVDGNNATVYGQNGTGKTTLADAYLWLLTGKNSAGETLDPFTVNEKGERKHQGQEPTVEAVFIAEDGEQITFKRSLVEKWVKKTGHTDRNYTGDESKFWIDGVPNKSGDYNSYIERTFATESVLRLLTNTGYFNTQIKKDDRRKLLFETFGDMADSEILADTEELTDLAAEIGKKNVVDYQKMIKEQYTTTCKQIELIPVRIDEAAKNITEGIDSDKAQADISTLNAEIANLREKLTDTSDNAVISLKRELLTLQREIETKNTERKREIADNVSEHERSFQSEIRDLKNRVDSLLHTAKTNDAHIMRSENRIKELNTEIANKRKSWNDKKSEWNAKNAETFNPDSTNCPTCGQTFPADKIAEMQSNWNEQKAANLSEISAYMEQIQAYGKTLAAELEECNTALAALKEQQNGTRAVYEEAVSNLNQAQANYKSYIVDPAKEEIHTVLINNLQMQIANIESKINTANQDTHPEKDSILQKISEREAHISELQADIAKANLSKESQNRIDEYEAEQKRLGTIRDHAEKMLYLCDRFTRIKSEKITGNINKHFQIVEFSLFEILKNGGMKQACETTIDGVEYSQLNKARQVAGSVDIIKTFAKALNVSFPLFIDNSESVLTLYGVDTQDIQIIRLAVSEHDKELRVERELI